jgi:hypothetical protein
MQPSPDNGGAKVLRYELYIDDGNKGTFTNITNYDSSMGFVIDKTKETHLVSGFIYRIMMRAVNMIGNSEYSDVVEIAMSNKPALAGAPTKIYDLSSTTSISLKWEPAQVPADDMPGGTITYY